MNEDDIRQIVFDYLKDSLSLELGMNQPYAAEHPHMRRIIVRVKLKRPDDDKQILVIEDSVLV